MPSETLIDLMFCMTRNKETKIFPLIKCVQACLDISKFVQNHKPCNVVGNFDVKLVAYNARLNLLKSRRKILNNFYCYDITLTSQVVNVFISNIS